MSGNSKVTPCAVMRNDIFDGQSVKIGERVWQYGVRINPKLPETM